MAVYQLGLVTGELAAAADRIKTVCPAFPT